MSVPIWALAFLRPFSLGPSRPNSTYSQPLSGFLTLAHTILSPKFPSHASNSKKKKKTLIIFLPEPPLYLCKNPTHHPSILSLSLSHTHTKPNQPLLLYLFLGPLSTLELLFRLLLSPLGGGGGGAPAPAPAAPLSLTSDELFLLTRRDGAGDGDRESYDGDRLAPRLDVVAVAVVFVFGGSGGGGGDALLL